MNIEQLIADLRARINPQYYDQVGTESYERHQVVKALEYLATENERLKVDAEQPPSFWVSADGFRSRGSGRNIATKPEKRKSDDVPLYARPVPAVPAVAVPAVPDEWRDVLRECADDLAIELDMRYQSRSHYPSELRKYENEMQPVYRARALLQSVGEKK